MNTATTDVFETIMRAEQEQLVARLALPVGSGVRQTIPHTALPADSTGGRGAVEWNAYLRNVADWLAEGREGQWVLICGEQAVGIWGSEAEADAARLERFPGQDVLIKQILAREPVVRGWGSLARWR